MLFFLQFYSHLDFFRSDLHSTRKQKPQNYHRLQRLFCLFETKRQNEMEVQLLLQNKVQIDPPYLRESG